MKIMALLAGLSLFLFGCVESRGLTAAEYAIEEADKTEIDDIDPNNYDLNKYEDILRNPDDYKNEETLFFAEVMQTINEGEEYNEYLMKIGSYEPVALVYAVIEKDRMLERLLEGDTLRLFGKPVSEVEYETQGGGTSTVPLFYTDFYLLDEE